MGLGLAFTQVSLWPVARPLRLEQAQAILLLAFGTVRHRLVSFRQKFGKNGKVLDRILRTFRVRLNIDNVSRR